jgi:outer membrane receptor for ferrienterochelin and colicin
MRNKIVILFALLTAAVVANASVFGNVRGLIHDPQHRPVANAEVVLQAARSDWKQTAHTGATGEYRFEAVPVGDYEIFVTVPGFAPESRDITITSGTTVDAHFALAVQNAHETVEVRDNSDVIETQSPATRTVVNREDIARTPGADATNSFAAITQYVPGAVVTHDMLHLRGGHGFTWIFDGVEMPNLDVGTTVGPQFDPKDIDYMEVQRGGYSSEFGDRAFGAMNVVTRSGFERNNEAELITSYGQQNTTNDQFSYGGHNERLAWYGSVSGNRTDSALETPVPEWLHAMGSGESGFGSLIYNRTPSDQLRFTLSARNDHYQVPNTLDQQADGIRDTEDERNIFTSFTYSHTAADGALFSVSPFYHYSRANYVGGFTTDITSPENDRNSNYGGGVATVSYAKGRHNARFGAQGYFVHEQQFLGLTQNGESLFATNAAQSGSVGAIFAEDQLRVTDWFTLTGGLRLNRFSGAVVEDTLTPRVGAALRIPKVNAVIHGFYGRYYQAPSLLTITGSLADFAAAQDVAFQPLHGERDEQYEVGLTVPMNGWSVETTVFRTHARNFFDHDALGNSNIFFPLTIDRARIQGWDATLRSGKLPANTHLSLNYSHQFAQGSGGVTGGLVDLGEDVENGLFFLDHDQRNTLTANFNMDLPKRTFFSVSTTYGSGFLDGDGPAHLDPHTTFDAMVGKSFGEHVTVHLSALNLTNHRYLIDNANSFGGTHFNNARQVSMELRYRFKL